jgi:hypothetical protein
VRCRLAGWRALRWRHMSTPAANGPALCITPQDGVVWCWIEPPNAQRRLSGIWSLGGAAVLELGPQIPGEDMWSPFLTVLLPQ